MARIKAAGYTLVEVAITVVLLGILAAIAIPRFATHYVKIGVRSDLDVLDGTISQAIQRSKTQNQTVEIAFIKDQTGEISRYQIGQNLNIDGSTSNATILNTEAFSTGVSVKTLNDVRKIRFSPSGILALASNGAEVPSGVISIQLEANENVTGQIQLNTFTETRLVQAPGQQNQ